MVWFYSRGVSGLLSFLVLVFIGLTGSASAAIEQAEARQRLLEAGWTAELADSIVRKVTGCQGRVIAVFDHDKTLVCGDITEGDEISQPGLGQLMIKERLFRKDPELRTPEGFNHDLWAYYHHWARIEPAEAYAWICTMYGRFSEIEVEALARAYYEHYLKPRIFPEMLELVKVLTDLDVQVYIVSASAEPIVRPAAEYFGLPVDRVHGVKVKSRNGLLLPEVNKPISFAAGKTWYITHFLGEFPRGNLLVFGDSWRTDGHMLRFGSDQGGFSLLVNPTLETLPALAQAHVRYYNLPSFNGLTQMMSQPLPVGWAASALSLVPKTKHPRH